MANWDSVPWRGGSASACSACFNLRLIQAFLVDAERLALAAISSSVRHMWDDFGVRFLFELLLLRLELDILVR
jgi:hypothetical protein